jgi:hypothetical protein
MTPIKSTRFPWKPTTRMLAGIQPEALSMRTIILSSRPFHPVAGRSQASETHPVAKRLKRIFERIVRIGECDWRRLNSRGLADIGETAAAAERARLGDPLDTPLGLVGGDADVGGRPLFAHRTSPLG